MNNSYLNRLRHWQSYYKYFPVLLFVFALLSRVILIFALDTYSSPYHKSEHVQIANHVLNGQGYTFDWYGLGDGGEGSFMPPPYVTLILIAKTLFPSAPWLAIQVFQAFLSALTAVIIYFIGREIFTELTGIIASFLVVIYPPALGYVVDIQTVVWETFWIALGVFVYIHWGKFSTWRRAALVGFVWGIVVLSRSNLILLLPLLFVWMVLGNGRRGTVHFIIVACVFSLVLGPWVVRNYLVHKDLTLFSTEGGFTLFAGNNLNATGTAYLNQRDLWKQYPELAKELAQLNEAERDSRLYQEGIAFIRTHPRETFSLALRKLVYFWWFKPGFSEAGVVAGYPKYFGLAYMGSYAFILVFSVLGFVLSFKKYKSLLIFYALFLIQTLVSMIFLAGSRFRVILEPLMIIFASCGIAWVFSKWYRLSGDRCADVAL